MKQALPSAKVAVATITAGAATALLDDVDWPALIVAVITLIVSYMFPEVNPAPSSVRRQQ